MASNEQISAAIIDDSTNRIDLDRLKSIVSGLTLESSPSSPLDFHTPPTSPSLISIDVKFSSSVDPIGVQSSHDLQQSVPILNIQKNYRIHLGTRPGFCKSELFTYEQSRQCHKKLIALLKESLPVVDNLQFNIPLPNAFSTTDEWGLEPYASLVFESCSPRIVEGVAAIIGRLFQQDAIGIFDDDDDPNHKVFAISRPCNSPIPVDDAHAIMVAMKEKYAEKLSAQFGKTAGTIEFHDFGDECNAQTIMDLQQIVGDLFKNRDYSYQIIECTAKSRRLDEKQYGDAIKNAGLLPLANMIETARLHATMYTRNVFI